MRFELRRTSAIFLDSNPPHDPEVAGIVAMVGIARVDFLTIMKIGEPMKTKEQKRREANERAEDRNVRPAKDQLALLNKFKHTAKRERDRLEAQG